MVLIIGKMVTTVLEPPDGGYGWVVVFASVVNNFLMVPLIQNVGLTFKDKMLEIGMTVTEMLFTLNVHASFGQLTGLINNLLLSRFGFRKVAIAGVTFVFVGLSLTSWVHNCTSFMVTFGLLAGLGVGLNTSSYTLAIKSYFTTNQNKAIGLSMTMTALGPILMPQIISILIQNFHPDGVILILASVVAHGYIGALLLQPVKQHMVKVEKEEIPEPPELKEVKMEIVDEENLENEALDELMPPTSPMRQNPFLFPPREFMTNRRFPGFRRKDSVISVSYEQETTAIMGLDSTLGGSLYSLESVGQRRASAIILQRTLTKTTWWKSEDSINLDSCYNLFDETSVKEEDDKNKRDEQKKVHKKEKDGRIENGGIESNEVPMDKNFYFEQHKVNKEPHFDIESLPWSKRWLYQMVELFGLDMFYDLRYVSIMLGVSVAIFAEINFTMVIPFLLDEYYLTVPEMAAFLSVLGAADIVSRFLAPHIGDCFKLPARMMIIVVLAAIIMSRCALLFVRTYPSILGIAFLLGCVKGLRVVYLSLVIPSYVPKERLATASAIQIVTNICLSLLGGYILGLTRAYTGSYVYCIIFFDCITALTIVMWLGDIVYKKCQKKHFEAHLTAQIVDGEEVY